MPRRLSIVDIAGRVGGKDKKPDRVLYARGKGEEAGVASANLGGEKISAEDACKLKTACWGGPNIVPLPEWIKTGIVFNEAENLYAFGLKAMKGATKSFQIVLEAYILKHIMFEGKSAKKAAKDREKKKMTSAKEKNEAFSRENKMTTLLRPNETLQRDSLCGAIADLLWRCGDKERAVIAVPEANQVFEPPVKFSIDGITEKLHLFHCTKEEELKSCVKRHIYFFLQEKSGGLTCLLYSIVLSKGWQELQTDMQDQGDLPLIDVEDKITHCLANLMMTGCATPYLHNGIMSADHDDATNFEFGDGKVGIISRNEIGFLIWDKDEEQTQEMNLGSRLKTPVLPIWVTCINGNWGVLFNPNRDLMKSYSAENRFQLFYFSNTATKEKKDTVLTIDTRGIKTSGNMVDYDDFDEVDEDPVEKAIQSKWEGAMVDWQGIPHYV